MDKIIILDFGSRLTALLGRRVRELGVYSEVIPGTTPLAAIVPGGPNRPDSKGDMVRGIIFSGSPESVNSKNGPVPDQKIYDCGLPILGICYGIQRITADHGGQVAAMPQREEGRVEVKGKFPAPADPVFDREKVGRFFTGFDNYSLDQIKKGAVRGAGASANGVCAAGEWSFISYMAHGDKVERIPKGFRQYAESVSGCPSVIVHETKPIIGLQFHPEAAGCDRGLEILAGFVFGVCQSAPGWTMEQYVNEICSSLAKKVGKEPVLLLISGGVDSTVTGALLLKALNPDQVHLMYMDTGLMRKDETKSVKETLERLGARHLHILNCENEFLAALKGAVDPEAKRKIIGDLYITIQERETARIGLPETTFMAQGTIYPDIIESGRAELNGALVKSHHNVGSPLVDAKRRAGRVVEPLEKLYKDEVRILGSFLGLGKDVIGRHPFPGPGLGVRILGEVTKEKCDILREADAIFINELKKRKAKSGKFLYDEIWQAFAVLLPIKSVGVEGSKRVYTHVLALRAINSTDAMTAEVYPFETKDLLEISRLITANVKEIGRVAYDISNKPPATIEWE
ncbi:MAG: glutamine-hydrolyzing GMP synthase [Treponema sp.]|nr:glutamine-hydrolyzing GMP synthase [Treponema sp.]